uniref:MARVEL domain-containing protein n=1 Tax=Anopheles atroparvus TaxID=41427 RepID=A0A182JFA8_ANOAO
MERYLRFYIKFQGYMIGVITLVFSVFMTFVIYDTNPLTYPLAEYYDYRFMGSSALVLGLFWFCAGAAFIYGVYHEIKQCLLPFGVLYLCDLFLMAFRDLILIWHDRRWYSMVFVNAPVALIVLYITCYLFMTLIALSRLFSLEPKPQTGDNFVRFNSGIVNPAAVDDEAALVC